MNTLDNIRIFRDTLKQSENYDKPTAVYYNGIESKQYTIADNSPVILAEGGTVSTGYSYADAYKVAILNFADALEAGGLVNVGAHTQEENICRCSNLYPLLASEASAEAYYKPNMKNGDNVYTDRVIYAKNVTVFKDDTTYENIEPRTMDVITCPAPSERLLASDALKIYCVRLEQILLSAIDNGAECIILGAWGCGAFGQSPDIVARAFAIVLNLYSGYFKKVVFAIRSTYGESSNTYKVFDMVLSKHYKGGVMYEK